MSSPNKSDNLHAKQIELRNIFSNHYVRWISFFFSQKNSKKKEKICSKQKNEKEKIIGKNYNKISKKNPLSFHSPSTFLSKL